jgi:hypothetical protein
MIVSGVPESEALASAIWSLAADESRLCQLALMWLAVNRRRVSAGAASLADICRGLRGSEFDSPPGVIHTNDSDAYRHVVEMARSVLLGEIVDPTHGAWRAHRHTDAPAWSLGLEPTALIGPFLFYAPEMPANAPLREAVGASA